MINIAHYANYICKYCVNTVFMNVKIVIRLIITEENICLIEFFGYCMNDIIFHISKLYIYIYIFLIRINENYNNILKYKRNFLPLAVG